MEMPGQLQGNPSVPLSYRFGIVLVGLGMIVLPVIYAALTALACWSVYFFATHYFGQIWSWHIGHSYYALLIQVVFSCTPLLVGGCIAIAMVKPFFARRAAKMQPLGLNPAVEPRVYTLIQEVCQLVGSPTPKHIQVNCELNASAGLRSFFSQDLILTLGLPLVAGLTERELAGVIAHEFGHFRQGVGMRMSYLIRLVNLWFARVVYERDGWDQTLEDASSTDSAWVTLMVGCARAGVWVSRGVLWMLMMLGNGLSGMLSRQMEYDADRWEMRVGGSAAFESTLLKLAKLGTIYREIGREMQRSWRKHFQLPDNLPVLIEYRATRMSEEKRRKIEDTARQERTGWFDTHPGFVDRVKSARQVQEPGIILNDRPARELFDHFESVSRLVTLAYYDDDLNVPTTPDFLIPLEKFILAQGGTPASGTTAAAPKPPAPVPMMAYDPSRFRRPAVVPESEPPAG